MTHCDVKFVGGLTLNEALSLLDDDDNENAQSEIEIVMLPPDNACGNITDEDSGDEDQFSIDNFPASQLRAPAEIFQSHEQSAGERDQSDSDEEMNLSLAEFIKRARTPQTHIEKIKKNTVLWAPDDFDSKTDEEWECEDLSTKDLTPFQVFKKFFDDELVNLLVIETNRYASQKNRTSNITPQEIKAFLGVLLLSSYVQVPRRRMFWEREKDTHNDLVSNAISRDRFELIMSNLHFADNNQINNNDKFAKVRPFFRHLNQKFLDHAPLQKSHSIDEAMVPYYGRHGCKQYIRGKPIRYGYKLWMGCSRLGYVYWFEPYQGASTHVGDKYKELGVGAGVILTYADHIQSKWPEKDGFHFYFDNFFNSVDVLINLSDKRIKGSGTIRTNRLNNNPFTKIDLRRSKRGDYECQVSKEHNLVAVQWNDNNIVTMCSNAIGAKPEQSVKRYSQKEKKSIQITQPYVIKKYNSNMGGVDRCDENISLYRISIRGKKWYFPLVSHGIDMMVHNAWRIHKDDKGMLDHLAFRRQIAVALLTQNRKKATSSTGRPSHNENIAIRFDMLEHYVVPQEKQTKCRNCHTKTTTRCQKCDVGVHVKCFVQYHKT